MMIRNAGVQDLIAIVRLSGQAFGPSAWEPTVFYRLLQESVSRPRHERMLVAEAAPGHVVGYLIVQLVIDEAEIQALAVEETCRRQGIASALLHHGLQFCREMGGSTVFLEVRESNQAAHAFYRSFGFRDYGKRTDYYRHPAEDAILMRLDLLPEAS